jgi:hypothetical protein
MLFNTTVSASSASRFKGSAANVSTDNDRRATKTADPHSTYTLIAYLFVCYNFCFPFSNEEASRGFDTLQHIAVKEPLEQTEGQVSHDRPPADFGVRLGSPLYGVFFFSLSLLGLAEKAPLVGNP